MNTLRDILLYVKAIIKTNKAKMYLNGCKLKNTCSKLLSEILNAFGLLEKNDDNTSALEDKNWTPKVIIKKENKPSTNGITKFFNLSDVIIFFGLDKDIKIIKEITHCRFSKKKNFSFVRNLKNIIGVIGLQYSGDPAIAPINGWENLWNITQII